MKLDDTTAATAPGSAPERNHSFLGKDISAHNFARASVFLTLLGLIIRVGFFVEHSHNPSFGIPTLDQRYYDTVAKMLNSGEDLRELHGFRPLLYPMFLAVCYKLGGAWGPGLAILVQHLVGVATGLVVALLAKQLFQHRLSGALAGLFYTLAPVPLAFEGELLIEPIYIFLICSGLLVHFQAARLHGWKSGALWLLAGAVTILAAQARANILVFLAVYPLFAAWRWWRLREWVALRPMLGLLGAFCMMIPWAIINMRQSDHFSLLPNAGGVNLYLGNRRGADGMLVGEDVIKSLSKLSLGKSATALANRRIDSGGRYQDLVEVWAGEAYAAEMRKQGRQPDSDPMTISAYWTKRTTDEIKAAPGAWLHLVAKKTWLMFWNAEVPNNKDFRFLKQEFVTLRLLPVRWVVLLIFAPVGIWAAFGFGNRGGLFILLTYVGCYSAGNIAFFICDRYRYPIWPALAVFAGGGLLASIRILRQPYSRETTCLTASMFLMAAASLPNWFNAHLPSFAQDYYFRSLACYDKGRLADALADVDRSIALYSYDAGSQHHRGNILYAMNRLPEAKEAYEKALKLVPGDSGVWNNLGTTLDLMGQTNEAVDAFHHATEGQLPSQNAFLGLAAIQIRTGQLDAAALTLVHLHELKPTPDAIELALKSVLLRRRGDTAQADALEKQARAIDATAAKLAIENATAK